MPTRDEIRGRLVFRFPAGHDIFRHFDAGEFDAAADLVRDKYQPQTHGLEAQIRELAGETSEAGAALTLADLTVAQLRERAAEAGVEVPRRATKAELIALLEAPPEECCAGQGPDCCLAEAGETAEADAGETDAGETDAGETSEAGEPE